MLLPILPNLRQQPVSDDEIEHRDVVERNSAAPESPAADAHQGVDRIQLARHQKKNKRRPESASTDGPFFETHFFAFRRPDAEIQRQN